MTKRREAIDICTRCLWLLFFYVCHEGKESLEGSDLQLLESISYNGEIYEYRENILTFLVLGIDDWEVVSPAAATYRSIS